MRKGELAMFKKIVVTAVMLVTLIALSVCVAAYGLHRDAAAETEINSPPLEPVDAVAAENGFSVEVLIDSVSTTEYAARGRRYIQALENAEYELRIHNPTPTRVAVALSVDGLNTIDARHTSAWDAHKWVIEPYGTISVRGWQMSSENARRFYFTTERDSYAAKMGQAANLGLISAVFFRERNQPITIMPVTPAPKPTYGKEEDKRAPTGNNRTESAAPRAGSADAVNERSAQAYPAPDDQSAATGIGRSVRNDVQWIHMDLDPKAVAEVTIRYEYRDALVRLGIMPRDYPHPNVLDRREGAHGFDPTYCPVP
jgi:hypothetical protein